jgi:hypothetical protein
VHFGDKYLLNDQQVKSLIESKYVPERTIINEESLEQTHNATQDKPHMPVVQSEPLKEIKADLNDKPDQLDRTEYTMAEYTVIGNGKKKKKKKKVKRKVVPTEPILEMPQAVEQMSKGETKYQELTVVQVKPLPESITTPTILPV